MRDALQKVTEIEKAIARISTVDGCKEREAELAALRIYVEKRSKDVALIKKIHGAQLRLKRRMGEILAKLPKSKGGRGKTSNTVLPVSKMESSRAQAIAEIPDEEFEAALAQGTSQKKLLEGGKKSDGWTKVWVKCPTCKGTGKIRRLE